MSPVVQRTLFVLVSVLAVATSSAELQAQDGARRDGLKLSEPLKMEGGDDQLTRLRKERYNAALSSLMREQALYRGGLSNLEGSMAPLERLARAAEPVLPGKEYASLLGECVELAKAVEAGMKVRRETAAVAAEALDDATYVRADLEIRWIEAKAKVEKQ